jgi:hypothetical protein
MFAAPSCMWQEFPQHGLANPSKQLKAGCSVAYTLHLSAGNSGAEVSNTLPGLCPEAVAVTALNNADGPAYFSNRASSSSSAAILNKLMAAPGVNINSTVPVDQGSYETMTGTSMVSCIMANAQAVQVVSFSCILMHDV